MVAVPAAMPVITLAAVVATAVLLLLQVPDGVASLRVVVRPAHTFMVPVMAAGSGLTVSAVVAVQPVGKVYVMVRAPADTPVMIPVVLPAVASVVLLLLQVPPVVALLSVVVRPAHTLVVPLIAAGSGLTVNAVVMLQPVASV